MDRVRTDYVIALGGNLPDYVRSSLAIVGSVPAVFKEKGQLVRFVSRFFLTQSYPLGSGPDFVNAVMVVQSSLGSHEMMNLCHVIEKRFDRQRSTRWAPRTLDLDIIAQGPKVMPNREEQDLWRTLSAHQQTERAPDDLILPHPRMQDRAFVLVPMCDVCPEWVHPVLQRSARALCGDLPAQDLDGVRAL